jgi:hypothetical protein
MAFIFVVPKFRMIVKLRDGRCRVAAKSGHESVEARGRRQASGRADQTARTVERPRRQLAGEQPVAFIGAGQPQRRGFLAREAEAPIVRCVADQQHGALLAPPCSRHRAAHQRAADPPQALVFVHRQRAEQHRRPAGAGTDIPQADRADDVVIAFGDERKPGRRLAAFAQPLGGFLEARGSPHAVEQVLARIDIERHFSADRHHGPLLSPSLSSPLAGGGLGGGSLLFEQD